MRVVRRTPVSGRRPYVIGPLESVLQNGGLPSAERMEINLDVALAYAQVEWTGRGDAKV